MKLALKTMLCLAVVFVASYFTYFRGYERPAYLFWDENYHVASAQKYLHGVHFFEPHPPLGKLLIAVGERLLRGNERDDQFLDVMYIARQSLPEQFSFKGYRFMPTLLGWLTAPLIFLIFLQITAAPLRSLLLSSLYIFDNAQIVHTRGAMLDSTLLFFCALSVLLTLLLASHKPRSLFGNICSIGLGLALGCILATKLTGAVMLFLIPGLLYLMWPNVRLWAIRLAFVILGFVFAYSAIWQIHFSLGMVRRTTLERDGYFSENPAYREILDQNRQGTIGAFPQMWWTHAVAYVRAYNQGVPGLDLTKQDETGSPSFLWPFGGRTINYRWQREGENKTRYLYLVPNAAAWFVGIFGIVLSGTLILFPLFFSGEKPQRTPNQRLLILFFLLYAVYMVSVSFPDRVMYLYHYFPPLFFSVLLFGTVLSELRRVFSFQLMDRSRDLVAAVLATFVIGNYFWVAPLTYYLPLTNDQVNSRNLISFWDLRCQGCPRTNHFAHEPSGG